MTQEEIQLLFKVLCAMLPYDIIVEYGCKHEGKDLGERKGKLTGRMLDSYFQGIQIGMSEVYSLQPYLRSMSSMTEEEDMHRCTFLDDIEGGVSEAIPNYIDWLNENHFDYRGLIEKGLALEAPEDMYEN